MINSTKILDSQISYLRAINNTKKIEQALALSEKGKRVINLPLYRQALTSLAMQVEIRSKQGVSPHLQKFHQELNAEVQKLSKRVTAASPNSPNLTERRIKYTAIAVGIGAALGGALYLLASRKTPVIPEMHSDVPPFNKDALPYCFIEHPVEYGTCAPGDTPFTNSSFIIPLVDPSAPDSPLFPTVNLSQKFFAAMQDRGTSIEDPKGLGQKSSSLQQIAALIEEHPIATAGITTMGLAAIYLGLLYQALMNLGKMSP